jgi:hypothetical protein
MSEFNDPDIRHELGRLSGPYPDDNVAFAAWQRRVAHVRRRRVMAWTTAAALSLVVGTVGVAALQSPDRHSLVPSKAEESTTEVSVTTTTDVATTESTVPETSEVTTLILDTAPSTEAVESPAEADPASGNSSEGGTSTVQVPSSQPPIGSHSATRSFFAIGGSITVRRSGDHLTVVSIDPAAGFRAERNEYSSTRVEVRFKSDNHESRISVRLEEGVMKPNVSENSDDHHHGGSDTTVPDDSSGDDHHGGGRHG